MVHGTYRCKKDYGEVDITIEVKETEKSYILTLVSDDSRYSPAHIEMLFKKSKRVKINKEYNGHPMIWGSRKEYFVIYPYQSGIPFLFELCEKDVQNK